MVDSFLTVEDINGTRYRNQGFYWHEINTAVIGDRDFSNVKLDFCTVSRETQLNNYYKFTFKIDIDNWTKGFYVLKFDRTTISNGNWGLSGDTLRVTTTDPVIILLLYLCDGVEPYSSAKLIPYKLIKPVLYLNFKELNTTQNISAESWFIPKFEPYFYYDVSVGFNEIVVGGVYYGFLLVNLVKSDFQFNCSQSLTVGKINKVALGTDSDYLPDGDMIGDNTPTIQVLYGDTYIPVTFDSTLNDYVFNLDLTDNQNEGSVRFKVLIESNDVINASETDVRLTANYETINNETKLIQLFGNGGTGRIGANITLTDDLTVINDVYLIGNNKTLTMDSHKIIIPNNKTFKAENTTFTGGENTIQQNTGSKVELTKCTFNGCTGLGSVIDCQVDIGSLSNATDFTTVLNECNISNCDMAILHGGELTIEDCNITGKISNPNNPYCLYQTDGEAVILRTIFNLTNETPIESDIGFNPCIFVCGENATINGLGHTDLQGNDINSFLEAPQYNSSTIDITYLHDAISDYVKLEASNGYCHAVSSVDKIYKTNVTARRL